LCEALWTSATSGLNTGLTVVFVADTGASFAFDVQPILPSAGGTAPDAQTVSLAFTCVTTPVLTIS